MIAVQLLPRATTVSSRDWVQRLVLSLLPLTLTGCHWIFIVASTSVATGGTATYTVELFNDEANPSVPLDAYTVIHVPASWNFTSGSFTSTTAPLSGVGTLVADPGFTCDAGPEIPTPPQGHQRVVVFWSTFADANNPETGRATHRFDVGNLVGDHDVTVFFVAQGNGQTVCSAGITAVTRVEVGIFADGFESGNTSAW